MYALHLIHALSFSLCCSFSTRNKSSRYGFLFLVWWWQRLYDANPCCITLKPHSILTSPCFTMGGSIPSRHYIHWQRKWSSEVFWESNLHPYFLIFYLSLKFSMARFLFLRILCAKKRHMWVAWVYHVYKRLLHHSWRLVMEYHSWWLTMKY